MSELSPDIQDEVPWSETITPYDEAHFITYVRLLDAEASGADWQDVARIVLHRDALLDKDRAHHCWISHLQRAQWMATSGYRHLMVREDTHRQ